MTTFWRIVYGLKNLPKLLTSYEKLIIFALIVVALVTSNLWYRSLTAHWTIQAVKGGTYTEGIVSNSPQEIEQLIAKLTRIGLVYFDHQNKIKGALAERWEVTEDGKVYTFYLREKVDAIRVAETYATTPGWQNMNIEAGENDTLVIRLKQPFSLLLSFTSDPIIPAGPFIIENQSSTEIVFTANPDFILGEPHLQRIVLTFFKDDPAVKAALQRQEIMGADRSVGKVSGTSNKKLKLARQDVLLLNLERDIFKDKSIREKIIKGQKLDKSISVVLATSQKPEHLKIANDFAVQAKKQNLSVSIKSLNDIALSRDVLIPDNYDLLVTTYSYGYDGDPYPFWHSSQIVDPGQNYAGYNSKEADVLIEQSRLILDEASRQEKLKQFWSILENDAIAILYPNQTFSYTISDRLKGEGGGVGAVPADRFTEAWKWYLKAKKQRD